MKCGKQKEKQFAQQTLGNLDSRQNAMRLAVREKRERNTMEKLQLTPGRQRVADLLHCVKRKRDSDFGKDLDS